MKTTKEKIFLALLCQALCTQASDINDFRVATWNTNGPRWQNVLDFMNGLDVFAIQESGSTRRIPGQLVRPANSLPACIGDEDGYMPLASSTDFDVAEYKWEPHGYYFYHYDSKLQTTSSDVIAGNTKQSMVIISRQRAEEIIFFAPEVIHESKDFQSETDYIHNKGVNRSYMNKPVLGIRISNSIFLNIHAEPADTNNEAVIQLNKIQAFMKNVQPQRTWLVMGDFNRTPQSLTLAATGGRIVRVVSSGQATRERRELDYGVTGGPSTKQQQVNAVRGALMVVAGGNPSDHTPVRFN